MRVENGKDKNPGVRHVLAPSLLEKVRGVALAPLTEMSSSGLTRGDRSEKEEMIRTMQRTGGSGCRQECRDEAYEAGFQGSNSRHAVDTGPRLDGRTLNTIRALSCEVQGLLPRARFGLLTMEKHQVLTTVTLGTSSDEYRASFG